MDFITSYSVVSCCVCVFPHFFKFSISISSIARLTLSLRRDVEGECIAHCHVCGPSKWSSVVKVCRRLHKQETLCPHIFSEPAVKGIGYRGIVPCNDNTKENKFLWNPIFQQDDVSINWDREVRNNMDINVSQRWVAKEGFSAWASRSLHVFLVAPFWGHVEENVGFFPIYYVPHLSDRVKQAMEDTDTEILEKCRSLRKNWLQYKW